MGDRKVERQLLGYLLDALDECEHERVHRSLAREPGLAAELARVEESLEPLRTVPRIYQPPPGLAARTCRRVFAYSESLAARRNEAAMRHCARRRACAMTPVAAPPVSTPAWGWNDVLVAVGVFLAIVGLLFPALHRSRMNMRLMACQNNLRQFGVAHAELVDFDPAVAACPAVVNPWMTIALPSSPSGVVSEAAAGFRLPWKGNLVNALPAHQLLQANNIPRPTASLPNHAADGRAANAGYPMLHPGLRCAVVGWNWLYGDGHVGFVVLSPVGNPGKPCSAVDEPLEDLFPREGLNLAAGPADLAPIVLLNQRGQSAPSEK